MLAILLLLGASALSHGVHNFKEVLRVSAIDSAGRPKRGSVLASWEFSHALELPSRVSEIHYFPSEWLDVVEGGVSRIVVSAVRGMPPSGFPPTAHAAASEHGDLAALLDAPTGSLLEMTFPRDLEHVALRRAWSRFAPIVGRATGGSATGLGVSEPAPVPGGIAPVAPGVPRDWYTMFYANRTPHARLILPRARITSEALWAAIRVSPCRAHAGLGASVTPRALLSSDWMGIRWVAERVCASPVNYGGSSFDDCRVTLRVTIAAVLPLSHDSKLGTTLDSVNWGEGDFPRNTSCRLANETSFFFGPNEAPITDAPRMNLDSLTSAETAISDAKAGDSLLRSCIIGTRSHASAFLGGGTTFVSLRNACNRKQWNFRGHAVISESLPWLLTRVPSSTLVMYHADLLDSRWERVNETEEPRDVVAARRRGAPSTFTVNVSLPAPGSETFVAWRFEAASGLLHAEESPPDAHRGVEIPTIQVIACIHRDDVDGACASVRSWWLPCLTGGCTLELPVVDFSMPYNVAVLVSTVTAFSLGNFVNALARKKSLASTLAPPT
jgi:hypothetical protein